MQRCRRQRRSLLLGLWALLAWSFVSCGQAEDATTAGVPSSATASDPGTEQPTAPTTVVSTTTSAATTSTSMSSTETPVSPQALRLLVDGLGVLPFGEPADSAITMLVEAVGGQPTGDSTIEGVMPSGFGGTTVRFVEFGQLSVIMSDGAYYRDDGVIHFAGWSLAGTGPNELTTPEGITLGSTVEELRTAFGDQLHVPSTPEECSGAWFFWVGSSALGFEGDLSDPPTDESSSVIRLAAGAQSEC